MSTPPIDAVSVDIGQTIVYGVMFDPKNGDRVASMELDKLYGSVGRLFDLLDERGIEYVLVGGIAMLAYIEGRNPQEIEIVLARENLTRVPELTVERCGEFIVEARFEDLSVSVLDASHPVLRHVLASATTANFAQGAIPCATPVGLALSHSVKWLIESRSQERQKQDACELDIELLILRGHVHQELMFAQLEAMLPTSQLDRLWTLRKNVQQHLASMLQHQAAFAVVTA